MSIYVRKRSGLGSNPLSMIGITFLLGLGIGFSLGYSLRSTPEGPSSGEERSGGPGTAADASLAETDPALLQDVDAARHLFIAVDGRDLSPAYAEMLAELRPGGLLLREENVGDPAETLEFVQRIKAAVNDGNGAADRPLIGADPELLVGPLGLDAAVLPNAVADGRDTAMAREAGKALASVFAAHGIKVVFSPRLSTSLPESAGSEVVSARFAFGTDPQAVAALGLSFAEGLMAGGILPVAKPYPGVPGESQHLAAVSDADVPGVAHAMLPFMDAAAAGLPGMLVGHVTVPSVDQRPAALSPVLVQRMLRRKFDGVILAEDIKEQAIAWRYSPEGAAVDALAAGCDAVILTETDPARIRSVCAAVARAVQEGVLRRAQLVESKRRLDAWQDWLRNPQPLKGPIPELQPLGSVLAQAAPPPSTETPAPPAVEPAPSEPAPAAEETPAPAVEETPAPEAEEPAPTAPTSEAPEEASAPEAVASTEASPEPAASEIAGEMTVVYEVKPGDGLYRIAQRHGVTMSDLMRWNELKSEVIHAGQRLTIHMSATPAEAPAPESPTPSSEEPVTEEAPAPEAEQATAETSAPAEEAPVESEEPAPAAPVEAAAEPATITYEVQRGDTLHKVAARFGVKPGEILEWNRLSNPNLKFGQKLKLTVSPEVAAREGFGPGPEETAEAATPGDPAEEAPVAEPAPEAAPAEAPAAESLPLPQKPPQPENTTAQTHTVAAGETLISVAQKYGVAPSDILVWNALPEPAVQEGQTLSIYLPIEAEGSPTEAEAPAPAAEASAPAAPLGPVPESQWQPYVIKPGDTATKLSRDYGVTVQQILRVNGIANPDHIEVGQTIKLPPK